MSFALERWGDKAIVVNMRTGHHMTKDPISLQRAEPNLKRANNMEKKKGKAQSDTEFIEKMAKEHFTVEPEAPKAKKTAGKKPDAYTVSHQIIDELRDIVEKVLTGVPEDEKDQYIDDNFNELVDELGGGYGDFDDVIDELVRRLNYGPKTIIPGMKYLREDGYTMFDKYIETFGPDY